MKIGKRQKCESFPQASEFVDVHKQFVDVHNTVHNDFSTGVDVHKSRPQALFHRPETHRQRELRSDWPSRKNRVRKELRFEPQMLAALEDWCRAHGLTLQFLTNQLFEAFLVATDHAARGLRFDLIDLIDRLIDDQGAVVEKFADRAAPATTARQKPPATKKSENEDPETIRAGEILELYRHLSGNRIRQSDRQALRGAGDLPDLVLYAGIMRAVLACPGRVGSFAYCLTVARQLAAAGNIEQEFTQLREKLLTRARGGQLVLPLNTERLLFGNFAGGD